MTRKVCLTVYNTLAADCDVIVDVHRIEAWIWVGKHRTSTSKE